MTTDLRAIVESRRSDQLPVDAATTLTHLLAVRASCRAFKPEPVAEGTIRAILATAQLTASWCNSQPWQLVVTSGAGTERLRDALYAAASSDHLETPDIPFPREYRGVHRDRRRESGYQLYSALGIERGDHPRQMAQTLENFRFFGAPHVAVIHTDEALGPYGAVDCGGYVSNFLIAATAHGVGSIAQAALAMYPNVLREELGLTTDRTVVCGISFGYPDIDHPTNGYRTSRAPLDEVVDWITA
ncbi:nitroreductase [Mycolicibacterium helvum]|uniref:Nitroreductase n=1 Tax=Mycolicibacterium helvum TaxID=1534349 RepID=A0A7I7TEP1_9MYCO|nr:nitroreductase [Mycolicibacterium helvum]BBY67031.1 nitroreductase [Mycolicibacterium helvum]